MHAAILFDLDGTLVDSYPDAEDCWGEWAESVGLGDTFDLRQWYGHQRGDIVRTLLPHLSPAEVEAHTERVRQAERTRVAKVVALPGVAQVLAALEPGRWGIVTSNDTEVARARLRGAGLPIPRVLVSEDDVTHAKPDPEGFLRAAKELGYDPASVVGIDDSPVGVSAVRDAGMTAVALRFWHGDREFGAAHAVADGVGAITFRPERDGIALSIDGVPV